MFLGIDDGSSDVVKLQIYLEYTLPSSSAMFGDSCWKKKKLSMIDLFPSFRIDRDYKMEKNMFDSSNKMS